MRNVQRQMTKNEMEKAELLQNYVSKTKMLQKRGEIVYNVLIFVACMRYNRYE